MARAYSMDLRRRVLLDAAAGVSSKCVRHAIVITYSHAS
jgi:hypothetical protein